MSSTTFKLEKKKPMRGDGYLWLQGVGDEFLTPTRGHHGLGGEGGTPVEECRWLPPPTPKKRTTLRRGELVRPSLCLILFRAIRGASRENPSALPGGQPPPSFFLLLLPSSSFSSSSSSFIFFSLPPKKINLIFL